MKRVTGLLALTMLLVVPSLALGSGQTGVYIAPKLIYGYQTDYDIGLLGIDFNFEGDSVFGGALAVGYDFSNKKNIPLRLELEYALFSKAENEASLFGVNFDSGLNATASTLFLNAYYDFRNSSAITPYLGVGLGMAFVELKGYGVVFGGAKESGTNFAWNLSAGVAYTLANSPISLDLGYRFVSLGKAPAEGLDADTLFMHQVLLGMRFSF
ncbi:MAG: outer membrane beta-barrel protein [Syntrophorhabdaceae bacterium]|nr:outer membrane beta-barrel protein [Syntrophorhabdaceae bacterium]